MKTVCLDTTYQYLIVGLYEDDRLVCGEARKAWKKQSELLLPVLHACMEQAGWRSEDIEEVVITEGPGSYTGVRIAMTLAKVLCTRRHLPLYTISTLQLYAGLDERALVLLDARSERAYMGILENGAFAREACILPVAEIRQLAKDQTYHIYGDGALIRQEACPFEPLRHFPLLRPHYKRVANIHTVTPCYLKEQSAYQAGGK